MTDPRFGRGFVGSEGSWTYWRRFRYSPVPPTNIEPDRGVPEDHFSFKGTGPRRSGFYVTLHQHGSAQSFVRLSKRKVGLLQTIVHFHGIGGGRVKDLTAIGLDL